MDMYKTRNTGTGNGMRGTRGIGGMLPNIPGNVLKNSKECPQTFQGMSQNIPRNVAKHSGKCRQTFRGMSLNISGNVLKQSREYSKIIWGMLQNILWNVWKFSDECIIVLDTGDYLFVEEPLLLNSRKRKRASLSFLRKNKNILN